MRNSGKTTRYVDEAIQMLFTKGSVTIIGDFSKEEFTRGLSNVIDTKDDTPNKEIVDGFCEVIERRLQIEHRARFLSFVEDTANPSALYIKKKQTLNHVTYRIIKVDKIIKVGC